MAVIVHGSGGGASEILVGIRISTAPTKTTYNAGEQLDLTGMVVQSVTSDGDTETYETITGWISSPTDGTVIYENTSQVTISWAHDGRTYSVTQKMTVNRVMTALAFTTQPDATSYAYGANLSMSGAVVTATYNSGATEAVTPAYSPADGTVLSTPGSNSITASHTENGVTKTCTTSVNVAYPIFGVEWDGTSSTKLSRTDAAAGFIDPVPYVSGASSYNSPFDNFAPWKGMVRSTDANAGEVVAIPKFYYKWTKTGTILKLQVSAGPQDGFSISPAHQNRSDGTGERDVVYVGRYHSMSGSKSTTGGNPLTDVSLSSARTAIHNLGPKVWQYDFAMRCTIQMLYLVEFANWNSQEVIGYGCGNNSGKEPVGASDSMPYHTGTMQSSRTAYGVGCQYRHIEDLWGNVRDWLDGVYYDGSGMNVNVTPSTYADTSGGKSVGTPSGGYPSELAIPTVSGLDWALYPSVSNGSGSTYISDAWGFDSSGPCLCSGGNYGQGQAYGLWYVGYTGSGSSDGYVGCRLQVLP